jgi:hypothetical protein
LTFVREIRYFKTIGCPDRQTINWMRSHIVALASSAVNPEPKPQVSAPKTPPKGKKKPKSEEDILANSFESVMATPRRLSKKTGKSK